MAGGLTDDPKCEAGGEKLPSSLLLLFWEIRRMALMLVSRNSWNEGRLVSTSKYPVPAAGVSWAGRGGDGVCVGFWSTGGEGVLGFELIWVGGEGAGVGERWKRDDR